MKPVHAFCFASSLLCITLPDQAWAGVVEDAPEAEGYELVYALEIPDTASFNSSGVPYSEDLSDSIEAPFDRVAYHLELQKPGQERVWVYVSMPALVASAKDTGVPAAGTGVMFQQTVEGVHVASNHPELTGLGDLDTGVIEFWSTNYGTANAANIPGASDTVYDLGDEPAGSGDYGSMQLHDYGSGKTLFAFNNWGGGWSTCDLGIGPAQVTASGGNPDWTFANNAESYSLKTLRVLVRPGAAPPGLSLELHSPTAHQVVQRQPGNIGVLEIAGEIKQSCDTIDGRLVPMGPDGEPEGEPTEYATVEATTSGTTFLGQLEGPAGWYQLELRVWKDGEPIDTVTVAPVGIGEVFITAGQSNSANHGETVTAPQDPRVSAWSNPSWQHAVDPQPIATGAGGSPWPALGDRLAERFDVPIGLISVGWGGTSVDQWRPYAADQLYQRLLLALDEVGHQGARAILWHQGESDAAKGVSATDYAQQLQEVIDATRDDAGWPIPWGVARAAYLPGLSAETLEAILSGQQQVIDQDPLTFEGPTTEDMIGEAWRYDAVHFNVPGLVEHAKRWDAVIHLPPCEGFDDGEECEEPVADPDPEPDVLPDASVAEPVDDIGPEAVPDTATDAASDSQGLEPSADSAPAQDDTSPGETSEDDAGPESQSIIPDSRHEGGICESDTSSAASPSASGGDSGCSGAGASPPWSLMLIVMVALRFTRIRRLQRRTITPRR